MARKVFVNNSPFHCDIEEMAKIIYLRTGTYTRLDGQLKRQEWEKVSEYRRKVYFHAANALLDESDKWIKGIILPHHPQQ